MAEKKLSFQKLTEDLDKLTEEPVEKSEGLENAEPVQDPAEQKEEEEKVEEVKAEETEEPKEQEEEPAEKEEEEDEKDEEEHSPEEPVKAEDIEKSEKPKKEEAKEDGKDAKGKKKKVEDKEDKDEVKKSAEPVVSEADFIGAMEAIVKSFGRVQEGHTSLDEKVESLSKSVAELIAIVKENKVEKSADVKEIAEAVKEKVEKSVQEEEIPEGKAVEAIVKSEDGVVVPEVAVEEPVAEEPKAFEPEKHINAVVEYFTTNESLDDNKRFNIRGAVNRVKRGEPTEVDVAIFKEIVGYDGE